jgi:hypothetical protein
MYGKQSARQMEKTDSQTEKWTDRHKDEQTDIYGHTYISKNRET